MTGNRISRTVSGSALLLLACAAWAQELERAGPFRYVNAEADRVRKLVRRQMPTLNVRLPGRYELPLAPPTAEEAARAYAGAPDGVKVAGAHRDLEPAALSSAGPQALPDGRQVWRFAVRMPGIAGLRLHFRNFNTGAGRVWVHDGSGNENAVFGPYSGRGQFNDGDFWSDIVFGDLLYVDYEPESQMAPAGAPPFTIATVSYLFPDSDETPLRGGAREAASCEIDFTCRPEFADAGKAVGHMYFETPGGGAYCSGTLLNTRNNSGKPYFLTAQHCIADNTTARSLQVFWMYQTPACNGTPPDRRNLARSLGSTHLVSTAFNNGDGTLLLLSDLPGGVYFSGWDPNPVETGLQVFGIHHPRGEFKRITFGTTAAATPFSGIQAAQFSGVNLNGGGVTEPGSSGSGLFSSPLVLIGILSHGPKIDAPEEYCARLPFTVNYGRFASFFPSIRDFLEDRTANPNPDTPAPGGALTSGQPRTVTLGPVTSATLFNGSSGFTIAVPQGATRLEITSRGSIASANVDLYARFGQDVSVQNGRAVADFQSESSGSDEQIVITGSSLRPGTYFIALGLLTTGIRTSVAVTATVAIPGTPSGGRALTSGQPLSFSIGPVTGGTLFNGSAGFTIAVPQGATRLEITLRTGNAAHDVDLYARFGQDVGLSGTQVVADHKSEGDDGNEQIVVTGTALRSGTWFIALGLFTSNVTVTGTITATVATGSTPPPGGGALASGQARSITLPPVSVSTLRHGASGFTIDVPQGATRLEITLRTADSAYDVDLYARFGQDVALEGGRVIADFRSEGNDGNEQIVITGSALRPGTCFIALGVFTLNTTINSTLTATLGTASAPPPAAGPVTLTSGVAANFRIGPVDGPTLFFGNRGFRIQVPQGATRLDVRLTTTTPADADVDLFARQGVDLAIEDGRVVSTASSEGPTGSERVTISPLTPGTYFIGLALFAAGVEASGTITATLTGAPPTPPSSQTTLVSGVPVKFSLPAVDSPTLFTGNFTFLVRVPEGGSRLTVILRSDVRSADTDLFVRSGFEAEVDDSGNIVADAGSTSELSDEAVVVDTLSDPVLSPGTYFINIANYTTGVPVTGTLTAVVERSAVTPPPGGGGGLQSGARTAYSLPAVSRATLFTDDAFRIDVPSNAVRLEVNLETSPSSADVDLFLRHGAPPAVAASGAVTADHSSTGDTGNERLEVSNTSRPALRQGTYYVGLGLFTLDTPVTGFLTATLTLGGSGFQDTENQLRPKMKYLIPVERLQQLGAKNALEKPGRRIREKKRVRQTLEE